METKRKPVTAGCLIEKGVRRHDLMLFGVRREVGWVGLLLTEPTDGPDGRVVAQVMRLSDKRVREETLCRSVGLTLARKLPERRVRWDYDPEPDMSWLEQWDTQEKYAGNEVCETDKDGDMTCRLCGKKIERLHSGCQQYVHKDGSMHCFGTTCPPEPKLLTFREYMQEHGDPERHEMLVAFMEERCKACGRWETRDSLGNIDFLVRDNPKHGTFGPEVLDPSYAGGLLAYQIEVMREMLCSHD